MGAIADRFGSTKCENEAEVTERIVLPVLTEFLGYDLYREVRPQKTIPALRIQLNREKSIESTALDARCRPDHLLELPNLGYVVACDEKGPDESLDDHFEQLVAYANAIENPCLLLICNGAEWRICSGREVLLETH